MKSKHKNSVGNWFRETFMSDYKQEADQAIINTLNSSASEDKAAQGLQVLLICAGISAVIITVAIIAK